jgi:hypothetical protein
MFKLTKIIAIIGVVSAISFPAKAMITGETLANTCLSEKPNPFCLLYVVGAIDGLRWGADSAAFKSGAVDPNEMREKANKLIGSCIPDDIKNGTLHRIVVKHLREYPEEWHKPALSLIHDSLIRAYPCWSN